MSKKTITRTRQYLRGSAICLRPRSCKDFTIIRENTIMHKNTLKKPKSQLHPSTLSHKKQKQKLTASLFSIFSHAATHQVNWNVSLVNSLHLATHNKAHTHTHTHTYIYIYYFIKSTQVGFLIQLVLGQFYGQIGLGWALWACGKIQATLTILTVGRMCHLSLDLFGILLYLYIEVQ